MSTHETSEVLAQKRLSQCVLAFVLITHLVFALPDVLLLGYAVAGLVIWKRDSTSRPDLQVGWPDTASFWVPFGFAWVFTAKLVSALWAQSPSDAVNNAFNHVHFLLWPALIPFFRKAGIHPHKAEPWLVVNMVVLMVWYVAVRVFFPHSFQVTCFTAGGHDCGLLANTLAFTWLWLFVALTRPGQSKAVRMGLLMGLVAGGIALYGTQKRTEVLGIILGVVGVMAWRWAAYLNWRRVLVLLSLALAMLFAITDLMNDRFSMVEQEVKTYLAGNEQRTQSVQTSVGGRMEMYRMAVQAIAVKPWLGWGAGLAPRDVPQFATNPEKPLGYSNFHNLFLQSLLEIGLIGSLASVGLAVFLFRETLMKPFREGNQELALLVAALWFTYFWKSLVNATFGYSLPNLVFVFYTAWFWVAAHTPETSKKPSDFHHLGRFQ